MLFKTCEISAERDEKMFLGFCLFFVFFRGGPVVVVGSEVREGLLAPSLVQSHAPFVSFNDVTPPSPAVKVPCWRAPCRRLQRGGFFLLSPPLCSLPPPRHGNQTRDSELMTCDHSSSSSSFFFFRPPLIQLSLSPTYVLFLPSLVFLSRCRPSRDVAFICRYFCINSIIVLFCFCFFFTFQIFLRQSTCCVRAASVTLVRQTNRADCSRRLASCLLVKTFNIFDVGGLTGIF